MVRIRLWEMKREVRDNVRVTCSIEWPRYITDQERAFKSAHADAEAIAEQIRRHVDGCSRRQDFSAPVVEWDTRVECSHCGREWETEPNGQPLCCDAAITKWHTEQAAARVTTEET